MEFHNSPIKLFGLLLLTTLMVGLGVFCVTLPGMKAQIAGWASIMFFSVGYIAIPMQFARAGAIVVIDDKGIEDRRLKIGLIRWDDIREVRVGKVQTTKFLCVDLHDPEAYLNSLSPWQRKIARANEAMGFSVLTIGFGGLKPGADEAWAYVKERDGHA